MMRRTLAVALSTAALLMFAAACGPAEAPDNRAADEAALRAADAAFAAAGAAGDIDAAVALHADDAMVMAPDQQAVSGREAVRELWTTMSAMPGFAVNWQAAGAVAARSGDIGYTWGTAQLTTNGPDGTPVTSEEKYVTIWRKDAEGNWKVVVDIFNSNAPPPGAAAGS